MKLDANQRGTQVIEVMSGGAAALAKMRPSTRTISVNGEDVPVDGDVITAINGRRFATVRGIMEALKLAIDDVPGDKADQAKHSLEIEVIRSKPGEAAQTFVLKVDS